MDVIQREHISLHRIKFRFNFQGVKITRVQIPVHLASTSRVIKLNEKLYPIIWSICAPTASLRVSFRFRFLVQGKYRMSYWCTTPIIIQQEQRPSAKFHSWFRILFSKKQYSFQRGSTPSSCFSCNIFNLFSILFTFLHFWVVFLAQINYWSRVFHKNICTL